MHEARSQLPQGAHGPGFVLDRNRSEERVRHPGSDQRVGSRGPALVRRRGPSGGPRPQQLVDDQSRGLRGLPPLRAHGMFRGRRRTHRCLTRPRQRLTGNDGLVILSPERERSFIYRCLPDVPRSDLLHLTHDSPCVVIIHNAQRVAVVEVAVGPIREPSPFHHGASRRVAIGLGRVWASRALEGQPGHWLASAGWEVFTIHFT